MPGSSSRNWLVTVTVGGRSWGTFDKHSGGNEKADIAKHRPGGQGKTLTFPGQSEFDDFTTSRYWDPARDGELARSVRGRAGQLEMTATVQALAPDGSPLAGSANRKTLTGRLSEINEPESDSNSNDPSMFELVMVVEDAS